MRIDQMLHVSPFIILTVLEMPSIHSATLTHLHETTVLVQAN